MLSLLMCVQGAEKDVMLLATSLTRPSSEFAGRYYQEAFDVCVPWIFLQVYLQIIFVWNQQARYTLKI
jgi:hypothetical protein